MKKLFKLLLVALMAMALVGCSSGDTVETPTVDQTYIIALQGEPNSMNPDSIADDYGYQIYQNVFSRLVKLNNNFEVLPDLASSWEYSEDGLSLTFHLNEGVKWHDGEAFTSADVVWTFNAIIDNSGVMSGAFANVSSVTAPDDYTVVLTLSQVDGSLLGNIAWYGTFILPEHIYNDGGDWTTNAAVETPIGTGPYKFSSWEKGTSITLVRNDDYFVTTPTLDKVIYTIIPDESTAYQAWLNDEIDESYTYPDTEIATLEESGDYNFVNQMWPSPWYMAFNMSASYTGVVSDVNVRKAISMAIDNQQISDLATASVFPASEYYIPVVYEYALNADAKRPAYDPEAAIALLEASGYTRGDDGYFFTINIKPVTGMDDVATIIQAQLKEVGINVEIISLEYAIWTEQVFTNQDYDLATLGGFEGPDILGTGRRWTTTGDVNVMGYSNATVDSLFLQAQATTDQAELADIFGQIQVQLAADMPTLLLVEYNQKTPYKKNISGHPAIDAIDKCGFNELTYVVLS